MQQSTKDIQTNSAADRSLETFNTRRLTFWNAYASTIQKSAKWGRYYRRRLRQVYATFIPPGSLILELGCGPGDLLADLNPRQGIGVDFSPEMIRIARHRYSSRDELRFIVADAQDFDAGCQFDVIILSDIINDLWDVKRVFDRVVAHCHSRTRIFLNFYSRLWQVPLAVAAGLGFILGKPPQNWLTVEDVENLLGLCDFEVIRRSREVLWPVNTPFLAGFCNRYLVRLWPLQHLALANVLVAWPRPKHLSQHQDPPKVSVIVPARNESGNIRQILQRIPEMAGGTEIVFVEGHSSDDTYTRIEQAIAESPARDCRLVRQSGKGKGDAVRLGFSIATGSVLMILDADLTVPPEDLPRFLDVLLSGKGEFINGVRLVYPMEDKAMRFMNLVANKFFSVSFSWLLGQPIKDTLCGTKVLFKSDYELIVANRKYFGDFDPFGDFDLIFGAARLNLKITDMPIRYRERTYGTTNIQRWRHGLLLIRMLVFAALRLKFI
jgi:SAM-dependent methyltransferase